MTAKRAMLSKVIPVLVLGLVTGALVANFTNGGFETGNFSGWTKATFLNHGLSGSPPFNGTNIVKDPGGSDQSIIVGVAAAGPESQPDAQTGNVLMVPKFGDFCARVNGTTTGYISNSLIQQSVMGAGDVGGDGKVHVRATVAPVLQNPGHPADQQPYFYVGIKNVSKGNALLFQTLNFSNQPGIPWQNNGGVQFTAWQVVDIAPGAGQLDVGDTVELEVIGADCAQSGHWGYVYVDSATTGGLPGLSVSKTANKALTTPGDTLIYTFTYSNGGTAAATSVIVKETVPAGTTFSAVSDTTNCSQAAGVVTCNFASLAAGASGTFTVTVTVNAGVTGSITNGTYTIEATGISPTIGPAVITPIAGAATDVGITKVATPLQVPIGQNVTFTLTVTNYGPATAQGVVVTDALPAGLSLVSATPSVGVCTGATTVTCQLNDIALSGTATVTIVATANSNAAIINQASVSGNFSDPVSTNNQASAAVGLGADVSVPALSGVALAALALALAVAGSLVVRRLVG
jgi:uncharacterized repeat protein (TIGR01451 family)